MGHVLLKKNAWKKRLILKLSNVKKLISARCGESVFLTLFNQIINRLIVLVSVRNILRTRKVSPSLIRSCQVDAALVVGAVKTVENQVGLTVSPGLGSLGHLDAARQQVVHVGSTVVVPVSLVGTLKEVAVGWNLVFSPLATATGFGKFIDGVSGKMQLVVTPRAVLVFVVRIPVVLLQRRGIRVGLRASGTWVSD